MSKDPFLDRYHGVCRSVEGEFQRNRELHGERIHCRSGCSDCCHQLFQITEIEAALIADGVRAMAEQKRLQLQTRASLYLPEREKLNAGNEVWGRLPPPGTRLACPALENGACQIYEFRPLICRKFGMPIFNPDKPDRLMACELNFKNGEAIEDGDLIQIQTVIHNTWKEVQRDYNDAGGYRDEKPISVARAILDW